MLTAETTERADQEAFIRTFLRDNVRAADDVAFEETQSEAVAFDLTIAWKLAIESRETEHVGAYKGDAGTIFVEVPGMLVRETETYGATVLRDEATYETAAAFLAKLDDRGLRHDGKATIRTEPVSYAAIAECHTCKGAGKSACRNCGASGRINCTTCSATGMTSHTVCSGSGRIANSSGSGGATTYTPCSCQSGKVTCSRCSGSRKLRCGTCAGEGKTTCQPCKGSGKTSTVRTMTLVAAPTRGYGFADGTSAFAREVLSREGPATLPSSIYSGSWDAEPAIDETARTLTFTKHAATRFLATSVRVGTETFAFRSYGRTLRVADGGGIVEHVLRDDKETLATVAEEPVAALLRDPAGSYARLTRACRVSLASRVHELAFARHFGSAEGAEVLGGLSDEYAEETVECLTIVFARLELMLSATAWFAAFALAALALAVRHERVARLFDVAQAETAIASAPYASAAVVGALVALAYFATRAGTIAAFAAPRDEASLRCAVLARGSTFVKTSIGAVVLALMLFAAVL